MVVTFLVLLSLLSPSLALSRSCVPNTQFSLQNRLCHCNHLGRWTENDCLNTKRSRNCKTGQLVRQGCSNCICQKSGQFLCSNAGCYNVSRRYLHYNDAANSWCTPFENFYVDCSVCSCPSSGKTSEANCTADESCQVPITSSAFLQSVNKNTCIPNVLYLFPCFHCICSVGGYFVLSKCLETCHQSKQVESSRRCISRTFYRKNCNVCWCPDDSIPDEKLCTKKACHKKSKFKNLNALRSRRAKCRPYSFLKRKCVYCSCNSHGLINENKCLDLDCLKINDFKYNVTKTTCSPGEMIPSCVECFCLSNSKTNKAYCTNVCSYQGKLAVLEKVLRDNDKKALIHKEEILKVANNEKCIPNTMYLDQKRYCLCPKNGSTGYKFCTSVTEEEISNRPIVRNIRIIDWNTTCTPNTFVENDCNTCYCSKNGIIDPKWCTYDDCDAKTILNSHKSIRVLTFPSEECVPGSVSIKNCNFCICPENSKTEDQACTKNVCSAIQEETQERFQCDPLSYYLVDCNVCLCPPNGIKNLAKCTKEVCEKTVLRSNNCVPGYFFSNKCNICICPPNGDKSDKVCTNHSCSKSDTEWKKIFKLSHTLLGTHILQTERRQLDVCFSGEEFEVGCKTCVCTDIGLRSYASCTEPKCEEDTVKSSRSKKTVSVPTESEEDLNVGGEIDYIRRKGIEKSCTTVNLTHSYEKKDCTPGSMYIIRCQQCICPYAGNLNYFCRPLPTGTYCEQAYPYFNYMPMRRRVGDANSTTLVNSSAPFVPLNHKHTEYSCAAPGRVMDSCFVCECDDKALMLIREHCFQSNAEGCEDSEPSFLDTVNKVVIT